MLINPAFNEIFMKLPEHVNKGKLNVFNKKSVLWEELFALRSELSEKNAEEKFRNFLSPDSTQTSGTSAWSMDGKVDLIRYIDSKIDSELLENFEMPMTGNPLVFKYKEKNVSMPFLWRFLTFQQTLESEKYFNDSNTLNIVEIGAGYGCIANLWIQKGRVNSYTIIDLPENLINSAFYLSENHPDWSVNLIDNIMEKPKDKSINLITPGNIENINFKQFDLAINSDSLGEMPKLTAQAYVAWLYEHIRDGGQFFSKNGHRRGFDNFGVEKVSEYGYDKFYINKFSPNMYSTSLFDDFSHIGLFQKTDEQNSNKAVKYMDTLANLFATGLSEDLLALSQRFVSHQLTQADEEFLENSELFFRGNEVYNNSQDYDYIFSYLMALKVGVTGKNNIELIDEYLSYGKSEAAILYCIMFMRNMKISTDLIEKKFSDIPGIKLYINEFNNFDKSNFLLRPIKYYLRFEVIKKKITPYDKTKRSLIMQAKSIYKKLKS